MLTAATLLPLLQPEMSAPRWWLGLSGGVDSLLLLHLLAELKPRPPLCALHVHHGLLADADQWTTHCEKVCTELGVPITVVRVRVEPDGDGLESAARRARYEVFRRYLGADDVLFLAHHRDDQLETLLLRLLRGSGVDGLSGMPQRRPLGAGWLVRPLLDWNRSEIDEAARQQGLYWVEDPSNSDRRFDRAFLRQELLPQLAQRWPDYRQRLQHSIDHLRESRELMADLAQMDLMRCDYRERDGSLALAPLAQLSTARQHNLVRAWLRLQRLPTPPAVAWKQWPELLRARLDAEPSWSWRGADVRRFQGRLYPLCPMPQSGPLPLWNPPARWRSEGAGELLVTRVTGAGLRTDRNYQLQLRRGGERCRPASRQHSQTLKKLFQEYAVPPWWRDRVPLLFSGGQLAAVGDYWVCAGFEAAPGAPGWQLQWRPPGRPFKPVRHG